jgi:hypothetical protein
MPESDSECSLRTVLQKFGSRRGDEERPIDQDVHELKMACSEFNERAHDVA